MRGRFGSAVAMGSRPHFSSDSVRRAPRGSARTTTTGSRLPSALPIPEAGRPSEVGVGERGVPLVEVTAAHPVAFQGAHDAPARRVEKAEGRPVVGRHLEALAPELGGDAVELGQEVAELRVVVAVARARGQAPAGAPDEGGLDSLEALLARV